MVRVVTKRGKEYKINCSELLYVYRQVDGRITQWMLVKIGEYPLSDRNELTERLSVTTYTSESALRLTGSARQWRFFLTKQGEAFLKTQLFLTEEKLKKEAWRIII
ncbi:MAG: hypothetical protein ACLRPU_00215 [Enterococcus hulanensis]